MNILNAENKCLPFTKKRPHSLLEGMYVLSSQSTSSKAEFMNGFLQDVLLFVGSLRKKGCI